MANQILGYSSSPRKKNETPVKENSNSNQEVVIGLTISSGRSSDPVKETHLLRKNVQNANCKQKQISTASKHPFSEESERDRNQRQSKVLQSWVDVEKLFRNINYEGTLPK